MRSEVKVGLIVLLVIAIPTSLWWLSRGSQVATEVPFEATPGEKTSPQAAQPAGDREVEPAPPAAQRVPTARLPEPRREPLRPGPSQPEPARPRAQAPAQPKAAHRTPATQPARTSAAKPAPRPKRESLTPPGPLARPEPSPVESAAAKRGAARPRGETYTIQPGDVLIDIARMYYGDESLWRAIKLANPGLDENRLRIGQKILVPDKDEARRLLAAARPRSAAKPATPQKSDTLIYVVAPGDTLISIARNVLGDETRWEEIYELNRDQLESPDLIVPGMKLKLPERKRVSKPASRP